jgi:hypothetical protein
MGAATFEELQAEIAALDVDGRIQRLKENEARRRALEADDALVLASLEDDKAYAPDGHASMYGMLRSKLGWSDRECRMHMQIARLVKAEPSAGVSLFETWASVANIARVARIYASAGCRENSARWIGTILRNAELMEHDNFEREAAKVYNKSDRKARARHRSAHANRGAGFRIGKHAGGLNARWSTYDASRNREVFDRQFDAEFEADWAKTVELYGDQACAALMPRTAEQLAADALTAIFKKAASTPPGSKAPRPVGNINIDYHTFQDLMVERNLFPERVLDPFEDPMPIVSRLQCQTTDGVLVDPDTVMRTLLEGYVRFVILGDEGIPIRWGRTRRLFSGAAKEAVLTLSSRCTHPGCRVRAGRCQIDHLTEWHDNGETCPENGGVGCGRHNRLKHRNRLKVERDRMGHWHTYRPDGTELR